MKNKTADENGKRVTSKNTSDISIMLRVRKHVSKADFKGSYTQLANYHICNAFQKIGYNTGKLGGNLLGNSVAMPTAIASSRGKLFLNV